MSITVKNISISIGGASSSGFNVSVGGGKFHLDNFTLSQSLLTYNSLSFIMCKDPEENIDDPQFSVCGELIGKEISLLVDTLYVAPREKAEIAAKIQFSGFIVSASGSRNDSDYHIYVEARSWDALLDDNPNCKSFENKSLNDIVNDVIGDYSSYFNNVIVNSRFTDEIPYCVQYNETNYQFLQRLARRYGEWLYNDGSQFIFGNLVLGDSATLVYPSQDVTSYNADLKMQHVAFNHVASSYNSYDANKKDGLSEMQRKYNLLSERAFSASQEKFTKPTIQNLHSGGFAKTDATDSRETVLNISTKTQARGEKAGMLTYSGNTYCSCLKLGSTVLIVDNYLASGSIDSRSDVNQYEILITELVHHFDIDHNYSNHFVAIPSQCDYPPYSNSDVYPFAPSCRAKVMDNEDPNNLGRIRVQFDWQAQNDETNTPMWTPWLRMAQPYAGGGKGFSFIPEVGEEVMIDFEGGNAERPFVKGTLYNGVDDVDHQWVANSNSHNQIKAIRTRNGHTIEVHDEGNDGYIRIYDNEKENYILTFSTDRKLIMLESTGNIELYAKNDIIMHAGNDMKIKVGNDRTLDVGHDDTTNVENEQSIKVGRNQEIQVDNNQSLLVGNNQKTTINNNNSIQIGGNQIIDIKGNKDERVVNDSYFSAKDYREEIDNELIVLADSQQFKSSNFAKIDGGTQIDIKANVTKIN